ncbi:hypothetical protein [Pseudovibrio exalbescens]|uniref:hypothetical protein n=1 Tax=Pseudovibrio exalbescens TaxID=197461 RepID=UPI000C9B68A2|nr:hypothetical protein [Pseudovibrio exalbescens]
MILPIKLLVACCILLALAGCMSAEERLPKAFSTTVTIPPGGYLLTVATTPIGATCHIAGRASTLLIDPTPGYMVIPPGYERSDLVCKAPGYTTFRSEWISEPYPATNRILIEVLLQPNQLPGPT